MYDKPNIIIIYLKMRFVAVLKDFYRAAVNALPDTCPADACVKHPNVALSFSANQPRACNRSQLASPRGGSAHRR